MADEKYKPEWRLIGKSVRGASHKRSGLPNQDAIWPPDQRIGSRLTLAVSDGHGSAKYFRSHEGAHFAGEVARAEMEQLLTGQLDLREIKHIVEEQLPKRLVDAWKRAVTKHYDQNEFKKEERNRLVEHENLAAWEAVKANPVLAYGATLLVVLVTEMFIIYLQLGDGDILTVSEAGRVSRPLVDDARLFANETTSLCSANAWRDFRVYFQILGDASTPPALILLSTDGYPNSFRHEKDFLKVGSDILEMIRSDGLQEVEANLEGWLNEASISGSGDDITLGIISRTKAVQQTLTVSQKGGQYTSIGEAMKKARSDARILVRPGLYNETCVIDKPLEIIGDGPREEIIIESTDLSCISMRADYAEVRNLSLRSRAVSTDRKAWSAVDIPRGQLLLADCNITTDLFACVASYGSTASAVIQGCKIHDGKGVGIFVSDGSQAVVKDCDVFGNALAGVAIRQGGNPTIQKCKIHDGKAVGVMVYQNGQGKVEDCEIFANTLAGVEIKEGGNPIIYRCKIYNHHRNEGGILVHENGRGWMEDCEIFGNTFAEVEIREGGNPLIQRCKIHDGKGYGIFVNVNGKGKVEECDIFSNARAAVAIGQGGNPFIRKCSLHSGKEQGVVLRENGAGWLEECHIYGNVYEGIEISTRGSPLIRGCYINGNAAAIKVSQKSQGVVEKCDLTANFHGAWAWEIGFFDRSKLRRIGNKE